MTDTKENFRLFQKQREQTEKENRYNARLQRLIDKRIVVTECMGDVSAKQEFKNVLEDLAKADYSSQYLCLIKDKRANKYLLEINTAPASVRHYEKVVVEKKI